MQETDMQQTINLLKDEIESWRPFVDALRAEDREIMRNLIDRCWRFVVAIESSKKQFLAEPFFLTVLLIQAEQIKWLESDVKRLREEIAAWKSQDGS
ncbi:MAG: hypothetical protein HY619_05400 [Thaumarchaeota archaeon]|nr:hypothetical protein [Nitrososphaerota archaeon]